MSQPTNVRSLEIGLFCVIVAVPLVFTPFTTAPLVDSKYVLLALGAFLIALARPAVDRTMARVAGAWVLALLLAAVFGLDPLWSIVGPANQATGVIALGASAFLLCAATGTDDTLVARIPTWLFWTGVVVAIVAVLGRFIAVSDQPTRFGGLGSVIGHRVIVGGFLAAATLAGIAIRRSRWTIIGLVVLGSGLAVSAARSSWIGVAAGLLVVLLLSRTHGRAVLYVLIPVVLAIAAWTLADRVLPEQEIAFSAAPRFTELQEGSAAERPPVWNANLRAWADRPFLGWGPGTGWHNYLAYATQDEVRTSGRNYGDAHNIFVEMLATTGALGVLPLLVLGLFVANRIRRAPPDRAWAAGVALSLGVVHLLQPLNIRLTPLMFLAAGLAAGPFRGRALQPSRWMHVLLGVGVLVSVARFTGSAAEWYGAQYGSSVALRSSSFVDPSRTSAKFELARIRAFDHRSGDPNAAGDTLRLLNETVSAQGWSPGVRLSAANLAPAFDDEQAANRFMNEHVEMFPNDPLGLSGAAVLALRAGDREAAATLAHKALRIDPGQATAQSVLDSLEEK